MASVNYQGNNNAGDGNPHGQNPTQRTWFDRIWSALRRYGTSITWQGVRTTARTGAMGLITIITGLAVGTAWVWRHGPRQIAHGLLETAKFLTVRPANALIIRPTRAVLSYAGHHPFKSIALAGVITYGLFALNSFFDGRYINENTDQSDRANYALAKAKHRMADLFRMLDRKAIETNGIIQSEGVTGLAERGADSAASLAKEGAQSAASLAKDLWEDDPQTPAQSATSAAKAVTSAPASKVATPAITPKYNVTVCWPVHVNWEADPNRPLPRQEMAPELQAHYNAMSAVVDKILTSDGTIRAELEHGQNVFLLVPSNLDITSRKRTQVEMVAKTDAEAKNPASPGCGSPYGYTPEVRAYKPD